MACLIVYTIPSKYEAQDSFCASLLRFFKFFFTFFAHNHSTPTMHVRLFSFVLFVVVVVVVLVSFHSTQKRNAFDSPCVLSG